MRSENPKYVIEGFRGKYGLGSNPKGVACQDVWPGGKVKGN